MLDNNLSRTQQLSNTFNNTDQFSILNRTFYDLSILNRSNLNDDLASVNEPGINLTDAKRRQASQILNQISDSL